MFKDAAEVLSYISEGGRRDGRRPVLRPARRHAALHGPRGVLRRVGVQRRPRLRRLVDPRVPADPRVRHAAAAGPHVRAARPVPGAQDAHHELLHPRPADRRGVLPRPAQRGQEGRGLPQGHRHRRHRVLRRRGRVLHLRQRAVRLHAAGHVLQDRRRVGGLEHRARGAGRQPRLQAAHQGRLLPGLPDRPLRGPARRDGGQARGGRHDRRARPPRGGLRRPGRDQLQVRAAARQRPTR